MVGKLKLILAFSLFSLLLLTTFNNCGKIELRSQSANPSPVIGASEKINYINIPVLPDQQLRAAFLLDMSRSMVSGPCADSIDLIPGVLPVPNCMIPSGVDNIGNRFKIIRDWTDQVQNAITKGVINPGQVKLMLVPFSGGYQQGNLNNLAASWPAVLGFGTITEFVTALNRFEALTILATFTVTLTTPTLVYPPYIPAADRPPYNPQVLPVPIKVPPLIINPVPPITDKGKAMIYFGTSVPGKLLSNLTTAVDVELGLLKIANLTRAAQFEIVFISDGVAKPRADHVVSVMNLIWQNKTDSANATRRCVEGDGEECFNWEYTYPNFASCSTGCAAEAASYAETGNTPSVYAPTCSSACFNALDAYNELQTGSSGGQQFSYAIRNFWGDWIDNTNPKLFFRFATLIKVFKKYSDTRYRFSFIRLNSDTKAFEVPLVELNQKNNWIKKAEQVYTKGHRFSPEQKNGKSPFSLFMSLKNNERYQVGQIFAINLNARVNSFGALEVDSDGDGVPDVLETLNGTDPSNPRSDGICLDSIKNTMGGCITVGCDPSLDVDGDGLNECEERTLGTDTNDFDTDGDGIPDSYEVLFGLNPLASDRLKTAGDGISNLVHFQRGAVSEVDLKNIPSERLVQFVANLRDQKMITDKNGRTINSPGYFFELKNIPLVPTLKSKDTAVLYRSATKTPADISSFKAIGGTHNALENRIIFMIRIDSLDNPGDSFWAYLEQILKYSPDKIQQIKINYEDFKILNVIDPLNEVQ